MNAAVNPGLLVSSQSASERGSEVTSTHVLRPLGTQATRAIGHIAPRDIVQWCACLATACSIHGVAMFFALHSPAEPLAEGDARVVMLELELIAASPAFASSELAPGPERTEVQLPGSVPAAAGAQTERTEARKEDESPEPEPTVAPVPAQQSAASGSDPASDDVTVPTAPPRIEAPAATAAGPVPGETDRKLAATMRRWEQALVAHLQRHKRYPPNARGASGTASVAFGIDRNGRILSSRIVRSSGSAALDEETLALLTRAQPFPPPPDNVSADQLSFMVPVRYRRSE